jgi:hypothetical protein
MPIRLSLALSALIFGALVVAQAWVLGDNPGALRLLGSVFGWMLFCGLTAGFFTGVAYSFDITDPAELRARFSRYNLIATGLLAAWLAISLASDAPPVFDAPAPVPRTQ